MTWGRDTDEHEARDQLIAFVEAGGTLVDTAAGYADGASEELIGTPARRRRGARRGRARDQGRHRAPARAARHRHLARPPAHRPRRLAEAARRRPRRPLAGARLVRRRPRSRRRSSALDIAVATGRASYVGVSQLLRLADRPGGDLAAGGARPGAARLHAGGVLPAQPRASRHEVLPAAAALGLGHAALVAAGPRRADRQVPHAARRPTRAAPRRTSRLRRAATSTERAAASSRRSPAPPTGSAGPRSRWRWPGCATARASPPRSSAPAPRPSCKGALGVEELRAARRDHRRPRRRLRTG